MISSSSPATYWHPLEHCTHHFKVYHISDHTRPFLDHLDTKQALGFNFKVKVRLRAVHCPLQGTDTKILSNNNLLFGLEMGKGGVGVGQACKIVLHDGGEVQKGGDCLLG